MHGCEGRVDGARFAFGTGGGGGRHRPHPRRSGGGAARASQRAEIAANRVASPATAALLGLIIYCPSVFSPVAHAKIPTG